MNTTHPISPLTKTGLHIQGYHHLSDAELDEYQVGIRFANGLWGSLVAFALFLQIDQLYYVAFALAIAGMFPNYHPIDYLYNYVVRFLFQKPVLPARRPQNRFACSINSTWLALILVFSQAEYYFAETVAASILVARSVFVTITHVCIPAMLYNFLTNGDVFRPE
jgi:hypothetical protein